MFESADLYRYFSALAIQQGYGTDEFTGALLLVMHILAIPASVFTSKRDMEKQIKDEVRL